MIAHLLTDSAGRPRKYEVDYGSGDSAGDITYYYDSHGTLRFAFARTNAVIGTRREDRVYYDSTGAQIYQDTRLLHGPPYRVGFDQPVRDPDADFRNPCGPES